MSGLFASLSVAGRELRNRIVLSPMAQYRADSDGTLNDWHLVHYGSRAVGGVALVLTEATAVAENGRLSPADLGIWDDRQLPGLRRLTEVVHLGGALAGVQLAHAGRKAFDPFSRVAPSPLPFAPGDPPPSELSPAGVAEVVEAFRLAARRAVQAGFDAVEIHGAHGYLFQEFLSPYANRRSDAYAPDPETGGRFAEEVIGAVRAETRGLILLLRLSGEEYVPGGYTREDLARFAAHFRNLGVDILDISAGGDTPERLSTLVPYPGYQVELAAAVRRAAGPPVVTVGRLEDPFLAESVVRRGEADLVAVGRGLLRDPYWVLHAAETLGVPVPAPESYRRAFPI